MTFHVGASVTTGRRVADNELKVAVKLDPEVVEFVACDGWQEKMQVNQLFAIRMDEPLSAAVAEACQRWGIVSTKSGFTVEQTYAIRFESGNYVSEDAVKAEHIMCALSAAGTEEGQLAALQMAARAAGDPLCARALLQAGALPTLAQLLTCDQCIGGAVALLLDAFHKLMQQLDGGWRDAKLVDNLLVGRLATYVNGTAKSEETNTVVAALTILESLVIHGSAECGQWVRQCCGVATLVRHLGRSDCRVQLAAVALLNAIMLAAPPEERLLAARILAATPARDFLYKQVVPGATSEGCRQLAVMQRLVLHELVHARAVTPVTKADLPTLEQLRLQCFTDSDACNDDQNPSSVAQRHFTALGFVHCEAPWLDLAQTPPGALAVDCLTHFAKAESSFLKLIVASSVATGRSDTSCPLVAVAVPLCELICHILGVDKNVEIRDGEIACDSLEGTPELQLVPVLWERPQPALTMFALCIKHLYRIWAEMNATRADVHKVVAVVGEHIRLCWPGAKSGHLSQRSSLGPVSTWRQFADALSKCTYADVLNMWQQERANKDAQEMTSQPILELRERVTSEMSSLVLEHALRQMRLGKAFPMYTSGEKARRDPGGKWCFWRLSANSRALHYAECDDPNQAAAAGRQQHARHVQAEQLGDAAGTSAAPLRFDELKQRISVCDMGSVLVGKDLLHPKEPSRKQRGALAFAFTVDNNEHARFNLVAPDEDTLSTWTDGLHYLVGGGGSGTQQHHHQRKQSSVRSARGQQHVRTLVDIELAVRMLDLHAVRLPDVRPQLPSVPPPPLPPV